MSQHWQVSVWVSVVVALAPTVLHVLPVVEGGADRAYSAPSAVPDAIRAEASWIREAQRPDGAIEPEPDVGEILPYLGNYAALGLARAASELHDQADLGESALAVRATIDARRVAMGVAPRRGPCLSRHQVRGPACAVSRSLPSRLQPRC